MIFFSPNMYMAEDYFTMFIETFKCIFTVVFVKQNFLIFDKMKDVSVIFTVSSFLFVTSHIIAECSSLIYSSDMNTIFMFAV